MFVSPAKKLCRLHIKESERTAEESTGWCDRGLDARGQLFRFSGDVAAGSDGGDRISSTVRVLDAKSAKEDGHSCDHLLVEIRPLSKPCDDYWNEYRRILYASSKSLTRRELFSTQGFGPTRGPARGSAAWAKGTYRAQAAASCLFSKENWKAVERGA